MKRVVVDPITRIEGHLRIEVMVDDENVVQEAYSTSTLWRGLENIVKGRDPRDTGLMVQRICGVCTFSHYKASTMAVENALGIEPPLNAILTRTLMNNALFMHDHPVHFYQLHALDFVDVVSSLSADPKKASDLAFSYTDNPMATGTDHLKAVQEKVAAFVKKGHLGPFANAYWGHKTYHFSPEQNLIALSHYLECLRIQRTAAQMMAIFGSKQPHPQNLTVGGVTCIMDLLNPARLGEYLVKFQEVAAFINQAYYPDLLMAGSVYAKEPSVLNDLGTPNLFTHQEFPLSKSEYLFQSGIILNGDLSKIHELDESKITEDVTRSWYEGQTNLHPYKGKTDPHYTGFKDEKTIDGSGKESMTKVIDEKGKYSWIKAPRYNGMPLQVGPLANIVVNYAKKNPYVVPVVDEFLSKAKLPLGAVLSTLGRTACRMLEAKIVADNGLKAFNNLVENLKVDEETASIYTIDENKYYEGRYIGHVPRGSLSHWVTIKNGVVHNYQAVVPSTWNASPKDAKGQRGSYEETLIGMKIADLTQPLEIIRKIHSYDPCIACAVHVMDVKTKKEISAYKVNPHLGACDAI